MSETIACPHCTQTLRLPDSYAGQDLKCPGCQNVFQPPADTGVLAAAVTDDGVVGVRRVNNGPRDAGRGPDEKFCHECGEKIRARAVVCPKCGVEQARPGGPGDIGDTNKIVAGLCGILLGGLGIHKFILGMTGAGVAMLLTTVLGGVLAPVTCGASILAPGIMHIIGMIEGIIYLCKSDADFRRDYVIGKRAWF